MSSEIDAGPVLLKVEFSLEGSAEEFCLRPSRLCGRMIDHTIRSRPTAVEQRGAAVHFARRTPEESEIPEDLEGLEALQDHIRMPGRRGIPPCIPEARRLSLRFHTIESLRWSHRCTSHHHQGGTKR
jgi:hypothetical protein